MKSIDSQRPALLLTVCPRLWVTTRSVRSCFRVFGDGFPVAACGSRSFAGRRRAERLTRCNQTRAKCRVASRHDPIYRYRIGNQQAQGATKIPPHEADNDDDGSDVRSTQPGRGRRGDVRTALLAILLEGPGHGYDLIQRIEAKTKGAWRPSAGSVYPTLQLLCDETLLATREVDDKRIFTLTKRGGIAARLRLVEAGGAPWDRPGAGVRCRLQIRENMVLLALAVKQVSMAGTTGQIEQATLVISGARKQLYSILSNDPPSSEATTTNRSTQAPTNSDRASRGGRR